MPRAKSFDYVMSRFDGRIQLGVDANSGSYFDNVSGEIGGDIALKSPDMNAFMKVVIDMAAELNVQGKLNRKTGIETLAGIYGVSERTIRRKLDDLKSEAFLTIAEDVKHDKRRSKPIKGKQVPFDESKGDCIINGKVRRLPKEQE